MSNDAGDKSKAPSIIEDLSSVDDDPVDEVAYNDQVEDIYCYLYKERELTV